MKYEFLVIFLLVGCGGEAFRSPGEAAARDAGDAAGAGGQEDGSVESGGSPIDAASGGSISSGGSGGSGAADSGGGPAEDAGGVDAAGVPVPQPPCCVDADCPVSDYDRANGLNFCTPWGTCGAGGDPYSCNYDFHCASYCYHCAGMRGGTCNDVKSCDCV